ncbi:mechanosensitive ion channel [candidate division KSB1 bacterium]|jgi:MscS family membrane protein|nr:mechanosensitive ion channel [candidate division KSB1 bacterium]
MQEVIRFINEYFTFFGLPGTKILAVVLVLLFAVLLRKVFSLWIIHYLKKWAARTESDLDDALIHILNPPLQFLILLSGLMIATWLVGSLTPSLDEFVQKLLQFGFVIVICWLIYRSADVFSGFLGKLAGRTDTELDDLLVPYLKKVIKIAAVLMVIIKAAEVFLGMSAAALFGLLGGMGLTLGLVFKDIIANWFGCGVIYIDNLFREGDWVQLDAGNIVDADVEEIGIRSTKFRNFDKTLSIVPNATIANAVVKNWSRMYKRRVSYNFTIDGLNQGKLEQILQGIRQILSDHKGVNQEFHMVNFRELAGNSRVIRLYYFTNTTVWKEHEAVREDVNLKILSLFEKEKIENLAYTVVDLSDDRPDNYREQVDHSGKSA